MKLLATAFHGYVAVEVLWGPSLFRRVVWRFLVRRCWLIVGVGMLSVGFGYWRPRDPR